MSAVGGGVGDRRLATVRRKKSKKAFGAGAKRSQNRRGSVVNTASKAAMEKAAQRVRDREAATAAAAASSSSSSSSTSGKSKKVSLRTARRASMSDMSNLTIAGADDAEHQMTSRDRMVQLVAQFQDMDPNDSGYISASQMNELLLGAGLGDRMRSEKHSKQYFKCIRADPSQVVTFLQFMEEFFRLQLFEGLATISERFHAINTTGTGFITKEQLAASLLDEFGADYFSERMISEMFASMCVSGGETITARDLYQWYTRSELVAALGAELADEKKVRMSAKVRRSRTVHVVARCINRKRRNAVVATLQYSVPLASLTLSRLRNLSSRAFLEYNELNAATTRQTVTRSPDAPLVFTSVLEANQKWGVQGQANGGTPMVENEDFAPLRAMMAEKELDYRKGQMQQWTLHFDFAVDVKKAQAEKPEPTPKRGPVVMPRIALPPTMVDSDDSDAEAI